MGKGGMSKDKSQVLLFFEDGPEPCYDTGLGPVG